VIAAAFAAVAVASSPAPARPSTAACPNHDVRAIEKGRLEAPEDVHPTHDRMRFLVDVGSDGRIRRTVIAESSGDAALDAAAANALAKFRFEAPTRGCVSASTTWSQGWWVPRDVLASPSPSQSPPAQPGVTIPAAPCGAPFVRARGFPVSPKRKAPGTAAIDVSFDATARVTAVHLAQSSGNKKTDYAATVAARYGSYVVVRQPGCPPTPTTYRLELTFR
jgi:TonB family protein